MEKELKVSRSASRKVDGMHTIATLIGWLSIIIGVILILIGIGEVNSYHPNLTPLLIGIGLIASSFTWLIIARLFRGLYSIVRMSEVQNAKDEKKYKFIIIEDIE